MWRTILTTSHHVMYVAAVSWAASVGGGVRETFWFRNTGYMLRQRKSNQRVLAARCELPYEHVSTTSSTCPAREASPGALMALPAFSARTGSPGCPATVTNTS